MTTRVASHAGSWYSSRASTLTSELDSWLSQVPSSIDGTELPIPGARIIIAPQVIQQLFITPTNNLPQTRRLLLLWPRGSMGLQIPRPHKLHSHFPPRSLTRPLPTWLCPYKTQQICHPYWRSPHRPRDDRRAAKDGQVRPHEQRCRRD